MEYIKLKDICDLKNGFAFKSSDYIEKSNVLNCRMSNIRPNATFDAEYNPKYLPEEFCEKYEEYLLNDGDLIIAMTDLANDPKLLGVPTIVDTKGYKMLLNQRVGKLTLIDKSRVIEPYLKYALSLPQHKNYFKKFAGGGLQINIGKQEILNLEIPYCEVKTQKKIVEVLDKAQELIDKRKEQIDALDELIKSRFIDMFGDPVLNPKEWDQYLCRDITLKIGSGATPKGGNSSYKEEGISLIRSMNVYNNKFVNKDLAFIDEEQADKLKNVIIEENDVLLNITGASVARCCIVPKEYIPARVNQHVAILRCKHEKIAHSFLCYQLTNESYQRLLWDIATSGGATREAITKQQIENLEVIVPPIELQNQFADFVNQVDKLKSQMETSLKELEDNFNSLMQKAFKGELF